MIKWIRIKYLIYKLKHGWKFAIEALGEMGAHQAVKPLIKALQDSDCKVKVRQMVVAALMRIGADQSVEVLNIEEAFNLAFQDSVWEVRASAISELGEIGTTLGKIGTTQAVEALSLAFRDTEPSVRKRVVETLKRIGTPQAIEALSPALQDSETWGEVMRILEVNIAHPSSVRAFYDTDEWSIVEMTNSIIKVLSLALQNSNVLMRAKAAKLLGEIKFNREGTDEKLKQALHDPSLGVRQAAALALRGRVRDAQSVELLIPCLNADDLGVISKATKALGKIGDPRAVKPLVQSLQNPYKGQYKRERYSLGTVCYNRDAGEAMALIRIGSASVGPLIQAFPESDEWARKEIESILRSICHDGEAVEKLIHALQYSELETRRTTIEEFIKKYGSSGKSDGTELA